MKYINQPDNENLTPLHLAVISGNARIVKKLLLKGANRNLKNTLNKTPAQIAKEKEYFNIEQMITQTGGIQEYCNIRQPFKPQQKQNKQACLLLFLFISNQSLFYIFNLPCFSIQYLYLYVPSIAFNFFVILFFILSWRKNPAQLLMEEQKQLQNQNNIKTPDEILLELFKIENDQSKICIDCQILKPNRSRHCEICKQCVKVYDHHCPWINNCVGAHNLVFFTLFIIFLWFNIVFVIVQTIYQFQVHYKQCFYFQNYLNIIASSIILLMCSIFFFPLSILCYVQLSNLLMNITTFERFSFNIVQEEQYKEFEPTFLQSKLNNQTQIDVQQYIKDKKKIKVYNCWLMCYLNKKNQYYQNQS
ncbi:hypothetical protein IMG5_188420 [Ichthyophthirius multifiliis]|uniref:Palmitoyltransferase n=1 Tax=Ichthyophthirius multifiliis TaxID=5932 RepID=G0R3Y5_ICHMU|nr:hypothetical protein IMG5_188420 [Ichthyophthirius multifiliis]EGR27816.1 hypothetical protein IMG5_188420 [Ichthyophthirius multifiliis]|eukprot:XP_004027161.1 hypothetical protein IMG5_188420 [Ichthyophthirius multifiliis]